MAVTAHGAALTDAHRLAQSDVVAETLRDVLALWPLLDPTNLDGSFASYARAVQAVLHARHVQSSSVSAAYLRAFREAEGVTGPMDVALAAALSGDQMTTSLLVTGPVAVKVGVRNGRPLDTALQVALVQTLGAASRLVQSGGRATVSATIARDHKAVGYARVTDGKPCAFCAMLASRGPVYKNGSTAGDPRTDGHRFHDKCGCTAEPVYDGGASYSWPGKADAKGWDALWADSTKGLSGDAAVAAFQKAYRASA